MTDFSLQGRRVLFRHKPGRIHSYLGDGRFEVLASDDLIYRTTRERLVFLP